MALDGSSSYGCCDAGILGHDLEGPTAEVIKISQRKIREETKQKTTPNQQSWNYPLLIQILEISEEEAGEVK